VLAGLLVLVTILVTFRSRWLTDRQVTLESTIIEVRGEVPRPGFHAIDQPTAHAALRAAGADPTGMVDAQLSAGTRVVASGQTYRLEAMDELLVIGLPIDPNTASAIALQSIPGIGPSKAEAIIEYRNQHGAFGSLDDLLEVKGIGPATLEKLSPFLSLESTH
jgi:competence protein ComEA